MVIGILKEAANENRVALLPEGVAAFTKQKVEIVVESGAGEKAFATDADYQAVGAKTASRDEVLSQSDVIVGINSPDMETVDKIQENKVLIAILQPLTESELVNKLVSKGITSFALDMIPRTSRAQAMDVLSSMATVSGYQAVLNAAVKLPNFFPMFMTAAGTIRPSKVLILGAGVAGLQAIATARKLGAVVEVFDVRAAVKEEVMSLGGKFVEVEGAVDEASAGGYAVEQTEEFKKKQAQVIQDHAIKSNVVICTAQIPGRTAPLLINTSTVDQMADGSVIIDLAASTGGNCEVTKNGETIIHSGVTVVGESNYPSSMPTDASKMFGKNVLNFVTLMIKEGNLDLNFEDDIIQGACITHSKEIVNERVKGLTTQNA